MTIPSAPVKRVFSITPVVGTPSSVLGIVTLGVAEPLAVVLVRGLVDDLIEAEGEETNAGSSPVVLVHVKFSFHFLSITSYYR
jgi:hypothetical protein